MLRYLHLSSCYVFFVVSRSLTFTPKLIAAYYMTYDPPLLFLWAFFRLRVYNKLDSCVHYYSFLSFSFEPNLLTFQVFT